jgi:hypothetical protein
MKFEKTFMQSASNDRWDQMIRKWIVQKQAFFGCISQERGGRLGARGKLRHTATLRENSSVKITGKLQHASEERSAQHHARLGLENSDLGISLHCPDEPNHGRRALKSSTQGARTSSDSFA